MEQENNEQKINGYKLSRQWFDFAFENPDKVSPVHGILYLWMVELNNQLGWKEKFGIPTYHSMEAIGVKNYKTYKKAFTDLVSWGFIKLVEKAKNNHTSNIIELVKNTKSDGKSSPFELVKYTKACPSQVQVTATIDKQEKLIQTFKQEDGEPVNASEVILHLNEKSGKQFKINTKKTKDLIVARQNDGFRQSDFIKVIDNKIADWKDDPVTDKYLRPETLFGNKFEGYLNEKILPKKKRQLSFQQELADVDYTNKNV